jgi:hypothetical protein
MWKRGDERDATAHAEDEPVLPCIHCRMRNVTLRLQKQRVVVKACVSTPSVLQLLRFTEHDSV